MVHSATQMKKAKQTAFSQQIDSIDLLKSQHQEVDDLFKEFEAAKSKAFESKLHTFEAIAATLEAHAKIEEAFLYPEGKPVDTDMTLEAYEEHGLIKEVIAKTRKLNADDETFDAKVTVLKELVQHHVKEEEKTYFPELRKALGKEHLAELGAQMKEEFDVMLASNRRGQHDKKRPLAQKATDLN